MMRYKLPTDRLVNMLVPPYFKGRKLILFLQSLLSPLRLLNVSFQDFAREKQLDSVMTSQVLWFTWYLNKRLVCYFSDQSDRIVLEDRMDVGVDLYHEVSPDGIPYTVWREGGDSSSVTGTPEAPRAFRYKSEYTTVNAASFTVLVPALNTEAAKFLPILVNLLEIYRLAGKTYYIKIHES